MSTGGNLETTLKLKSSLATSNMVLFDSEGKIKKYETAEEIVRDFAKTRLTMYDKRKEFLVGRLTRECEILSAKARFIKLVVSAELVVKRRKIKDLISELRQRSFKPLAEMKGHGAEPKDNEGDEEGGDGEGEEEAAEEEEEAGGGGGEGSPIRALTNESVSAPPAVTVALSLVR